MGVRENKVETYLKDEVERIGGVTRKWVSPGHPGVMDQIVRLHRWPKGLVCFVEVKTTDGKQEPHQSREERRLTDAGCWTDIVYGNDDVDRMISNWIEK